ncbi:MAG: carbohydrate ABC transporter permease, partial [Spirochaetales bacterium]|nr:carbohydrate ABC transporter permease [Spirochaetales bacterium]
MAVRWKRVGSGALVALGIGVIFVIIAFPLYWMAITSFKPYKEIFQRIPTFFPQKPVVEHYVAIVRDGLFGYFGNSLIVSVAATAVSVSIGILAAYSISHFRYRGRALFSQLILYVYLFPGAVLFIPLLIVINTLGLTNTLLALVVAYPVFGMPFAAWVLTGYFSTIPRELEEAARVDGCSRMAALFRVILPVAMPGIVSATIYCFLLSWNELLYAFTFITSEAKKTLPMWLSERILGDVFMWGELMAGAILMLVPILLIYSLGTKYLVRGLTAGAV